VDGRVEIVDARSCWAEEGRRWARAVRRAMGDLAIEIDHVGSTAVPGLAAKDVIDLQATVLNLSPADAIVAPLIADGFLWRRETRDDPAKPGYPPAPHHWEKLFFREPAGARRVHLHIRKLGGAGARTTLLLRDFLRADEASRADYDALKRALAAAIPNDRETYTDLKTPWISTVLRLAEAWAQKTRWRPGAPDA
jgi:GrpB-like predicted nucleotidyltransferase (UPF0157 family)